MVVVAQEHYLRDDIYCGYVGCSQCSQEKPVLTDGIAVLIDSNVALHQVRLLHPFIKES